MDGIDELRTALRGNVLLPDDPAFEKTQLVWAVSAGHTDKKLPVPALVVQPRGTSDVVAALKFAASRGMAVAAKSGGHGPGNPSCTDGGMMVDLSLMRSVYVDPVARTAVVDGGCLAIDIDLETAQYGLAVPLGVCSVVGMGLALNGGLSLLSRTYGAACDNILEVQVVLADGSLVNVTKASDPELLWALKGAGTTLGVVTKIKFQCHDVSSAYCGTLVWQDDPEHHNYRTVMRWIRDVVLPDTTVGCNLARALHPHMGPVLVSMIVLLGDETHAEKEERLKPLRDLAPMLDTVGKASWLETQRTHEPGVRGVTTAFPVHYEAIAGGAVQAEKVTDEFIETFLRLTAEELPLPDCPLTLAFWELMGGKLKESPAPIGLTKGDVQWVVQVGWADPAYHETGMRYAAAINEALAPHTLEPFAYVNMLDTAAFKRLTYAQAAAKVGGVANLERLRAVKARVDPGNVFRSSVHTLVLAAADAEP